MRGLFFAPQKIVYYLLSSRPLEVSEPARGHRQAAGGLFGMVSIFHKPEHIDPGLSVYEGKTAYAVALHEWVNGGNGICIFMCSGK